MQLPPALTNLASNSVAQIVAFAGLAVLVTQLASTSPATIDSDLVATQNTAVRASSTDQPAQTDSTENTSADAKTSDADVGSSVGQTPQFLLPTGLAAASGPVRSSITTGPPVTTPQNSPTKVSSNGNSSRRTFTPPPVRRVKPWFTDGPQDPESTVQLSPQDQAAWEADAALMHTDHPYYDGRFTTAELGEINRIRSLDRNGKLKYVDSLGRVRNWVEELNRTGQIAPSQGQAYKIRLDHANNLYDEATYDGNLEPSKPVSLLRRAASTVIDFIPLAGNVKSFYEAVAGVDPITGEELSALDRAAAAGSVLLPGLKVAKKGLSIVKGVLKYGDDAIDAERFAVGLVKSRRAKSLTKNTPEAFHYTSAESANMIKKEGLRPNSYATPAGNLSSIQAKLDLALNPARPAPTTRIRIDVEGLRKAGFHIPETNRVSNVVKDSRTGRVYRMPGGGEEMQFPYAIPPEFLEVLPIK